MSDERWAGVPVAWAAVANNGAPLWLGYDRPALPTEMRVIPLYRHAKPTLTPEERAAVEAAIGWVESPSVDDEAMPEDYLPITTTLRGLLERTTCPARFVTKSL